MNSRDHALAAIYVGIGFECAARLDRERYEYLADILGNSGLMSMLVDFIEDAVKFVMEDTREYPGVWLYEVAHAWGIYLFKDWEAIDNESFLLYAKRMIDKWIETEGKVCDTD